MLIVDLDSHSRPRPQDYTIPPEYRHLRPIVHVDAQGNIERMFDNMVVSVLTAGEKHVAEKLGRGHWKSAEYDGELRYQQVKQAGIDYQFVSAGSVGMFTYTDLTVGSAYIRGSNNFIYERFMKSHPDTFTGLPQLPLQDIGAAIKELERCVNDLGMFCFLMPTNVNGIDMADRYWWNFYDRVRELGITGIIVHVGTFHPMSQWVGHQRLKVLGPDGTAGRHIVSQPFEYCTNILNLIFGGIMDRFPEFRFAFLETGAEFVINLKHRIEENLEQIPYLQDKLTGPIQKYFDRFYFVVDDYLLDEDGAGLNHAIKHLGADHLFFGSDYPHVDGMLDMPERLKAVPGLSPENQAKILGGNTLTFLGEQGKKLEGSLKSAETQKPKAAKRA
jgi:aminocarboxymuconate-semialdehyde decarboxylase